MDMATLNVAKLDRHQRWRSACAQILRATRKAEELLLLQDFLLVEVCPEESDVFTHPTAQPHTAETWSKTEETRAQTDADASNLPENIAAGETEKQMQTLEHQLLELQSTHKDQDHPEIATILHELGQVSQQAGDLQQAEQHFGELLTMDRSLHGDRDHPDIAANTA